MLCSFISTFLCCIFMYEYFSQPKFTDYEQEDQWSIFAVWLSFSVFWASVAFAKLTTWELGSFWKEIRCMLTV